MNKYLVAISLALAALSAHAQVVTVRGMGSANYKQAATAEDKAKALKAAQINAVERYFAENGDAETQNFDKIRGALESSLNEFVLGSTILNEEDQASKKQYVLVVRVELNVPRLRNAIKASTAVGAAPGAARSTLTFLFVGRQAASVRTFDARTYARTDESRSAEGTAAVSHQGKEREQISAQSVETKANVNLNASASVNTSAEKETGGSTTQKADDVAWRIVPTGYVNSAVSGIFASSGFEVVDAAYIEPESGGLLSIKNMEQDYTSGNDLKPQTLRNTAGGLQKAGIPYMALTTIDIGIRDKDPATGLVRVNVTVTGKVLDLQGRFPKTVSSVGPVQYAGIGQNEEVATTNAIKQAASTAARELVSQINTVGVK
jgi:hypothetical protein